MSVKPGVTGMWKVNGRSEITDFEEVVKLDTSYIVNWSLFLDVKILFKTIKVLFTHKGKDGVNYNLRAFPIGGFVAMAGEVYEDDKKVDKDRNLCNRPWLQRLIIMVAGVMNNFILAIFILFLLALNPDKVRLLP